MINLTTGIDAVVYGHFHNTDYREDILNAEGKVVPGAGRRRQAKAGLLEARLQTRRSKSCDPVTAENGYRFLADQEGLVENQKVATALAPYNEELQAYLDQPLGTATGAFSNENISLQPTALMDLLNKAQLSAVPAQLSICAPLTSGANVRDLIPAATFRCVCCISCTCLKTGSIA